MAADDEDKRVRARALRNWVLPFAVLGAGVFILLGLGHSADSGRSLLRAMSQSESGIESEVLGNVAQLVGQVLGVAISVVAIIVELAANRYTHRITELFFRARTNIFVMGLYVVSAVQAMWASYSAGGGTVPRFASMLAMTLMTVSVLSLLPYFAYVAAFVSPLEVIRRLRREALRVVEAGPKSTALTDVERAQHAATESAEQLTDVAFNAMVHHDKAISMAAINAIGDLLKDYLELKTKLPPEWFKLNATVRSDPDFVSLAPIALEQIEESRTWFEFMLLRQYEMVYRQALNTHRELNYLIASNVRELAAHALSRNDRAVWDLSVKFFNTFMRATLNGRDVRTGYNVLNQYRLLGELALRKKTPGLAGPVARHFKYYGQLAFNMDLGFLLETAAYDLCALNELAFDLNSPERPELLKVFLQVDKEGEGAKRETALRGVRKAQIKLAAYYLHRGDQSAARQVYKDMANENVQRLASIRDELLAVESPHYWEVTDRGMNFDWLPDDRRGRLFEFFEWFGDALPQPRASIVLPMSAVQFMGAALKSASPIAPSIVAAATVDEDDPAARLRDPGAATEGSVRDGSPVEVSSEPAPRPAVDDEE
jgi:hypothetical protein